MTQETIDKQMANICYYLGHETLERKVENPTIIEFLHSMAWTLDVIGGPKRWFFIFGGFDYMDLVNFVASNRGFFNQPFYRNTLLINFDGYEFTIVKELPQ